MAISSDGQKTEELLKAFEEKPPMIIGGYKRQGWAQKALDKIENDNIEEDSDGLITVKAILQANDESFYPAFLVLDTKQNAKITGVYFLSETDDHFDLIPLELALPYIKKESNLLMPFRYKTIEKIENDQYQMNWPDFS